MKVVIFNVRYSPNLGDGLLSECLESELSSQGLSVSSVDLAGRLGYGDGLGKHRRLALRVLDASPLPVRRTIVGMTLGRTVNHRLRPRWRSILTEADAVVVGGGNLMADQDLNFPLKVSAALQEAAAAELPVTIFGVGVSDNWSLRGQALFEAGLAQAKPAHIAVRDERSKSTWNRRLAHLGLASPQICRDPGVLAARHFRPALQAQPGVRVALGVTDPLALRYHSAGDSISERALTDWLAEFVRQLTRRGWNVRLFTNGSPEDRAHLERITPQLIAQAPQQVEVAPAFDRPAELASFISGSDLICAHRLHACIAAFAYAKPHIGFVWDPKLDAFFESTGRSRFVVNPLADAPAEAATLAAQAIEEGIDPDNHRQVVQSACDDVSRLRHALVDAVSQRRGAA